MAAHNLTAEEAIEAIEAVDAAGGNVTHAAERLGIARATLQARIQRARQMRASGKLNVIATVPTTPVDSYQEAWQRLQRAVGMTKERYAGPPKKRKAGKRIKVTAAGDFHVPFHDRAAVAELIAREADTTDLLVIGGDFGDAYAASTFTKNETVPFKEELAESMVCLEALSQAFQKVKYLRGSNHMDRIEKRVREGLDSNVVDAILYMTGGELSPDLAMCRRFPNIEIDCWVTPSGDRVPWLMVVGDVAFSHAEKYSRIPGNAMRSVEEWLDDFSGTLGLPDVSALVQFHTHAMGVLPWRSDKVLIEPGCMCTTHGYQLRSKIAGRPQRVGYVTMELEDGRLDYDSIRLRWLNRHAGKVA